MAAISERILILCKTYPSPSAGHAETSCVAGITESGEMRRIFPVPFRLIDDAQQFKKWQWITAKVEKARNDHRPESHTIFIDTIECEEPPIPSTNGWQKRRPWIDRIPTFQSFNEAERARQTDGITLALIKPSRIVGLDITALRDPEWTDEERAKLLREQNQGNLFQEPKTVRLLKKLPFDFHYRYECADGLSHRHKIVDWEAGALYWNVVRQHRNDWEQPFRARYEAEFSGKDLGFLLGTMHRFPDQWLIVSVIYPPRRPDEAAGQASLF